MYIADEKLQESLIEHGIGRLDNNNLRYKI